MSPLRNPLPVNVAAPAPAATFGLAAVPVLALALVLTVVLALGLAGCVPNRPAAKLAPAEAIEQVRDATAKLIRQNDADSFAAAAALVYIDARDTAIQLSAQAAADAPDRGDLAWLRLRICASTPTCDPLPAELALRNVDPGNSAAWLGALERANKIHDEPGVDAALAGMAKGDRFDIYVNPIISHLATAFANAKVKPLPDALDFLGETSVILLPPFRAIGDPCKGEALTRNERLQACRAIAASLSRGDSIITQSYATVMNLRTWPPDSREAKAAIEARRQSHYLRSMVGQIDDGKKLNEQRARDYVQLIAANSSEEASLRALVTATGRSPYAPSGWVDAQP
jgi:hypothetical protein